VADFGFCQYFLSTLCSTISRQKTTKNRPYSNLIFHCSEFYKLRGVGYLRPWAQVSYNHQYGENLWKAQSGMRANVASGQDGNWMDITVGADIPIGKNMEAFASMSQAEGLTTGEAYLYNVGVSAKF